MDGRLLGASARLSLVASLCSSRSMSGTVPVRPVPVLLSVRSAIPRAPTLPAYHRTVLNRTDGPVRGSAKSENRTEPDLTIPIESYSEENTFSTIILYFYFSSIKINFYKILPRSN